MLLIIPRRRCGTALQHPHCTLNISTYSAAHAHHVARLSPLLLDDQSVYHLLREDHRHEVVLFELLDAFAELEHLQRGERGATNRGSALALCF